jgi:hypothetical protein
VQLCIGDVFLLDDERSGSNPDGHWAISTGKSASVYQRICSGGIRRFGPATSNPKNWGLRCDKNVIVLRS